MCWNPSFQCWNNKFAVNWKTQFGRFFSPTSFTKDKSTVRSSLIPWLIYIQICRSCMCHPQVNSKWKGPTPAFYTKANLIIVGVILLNAWNEGVQSNEIVLSAICLGVDVSLGGRYISWVTLDPTNFSIYFRWQGRDGGDTQEIKFTANLCL